MYVYICIYIRICRYYIVISTVHKLRNIHNNMRFWRKVSLGHFIDPFGQDSFPKVLLTRSDFEWNRIFSQEQNWSHFGLWRFLVVCIEALQDKRCTVSLERERERQRANSNFLPPNPGRWKSGKFLLPSFNFSQWYMQKSHILQQLPEICTRIQKASAPQPWKIPPNPAQFVPWSVHMSLQPKRLVWTISKWDSLDLHLNEIRPSQT